MSAWCYVLRLKSGNLYIGSTSNIDQRYQNHLNGHACRTTKYDPAVTIIYSEKYDNLKEARKREDQIKRWSRDKKEALVSRDFSRLRELAKSRKK